VLRVQDQTENTHDGDLYDDVITSRDDPVDEVCHSNDSVWYLLQLVMSFKYTCVLRRHHFNGLFPGEPGLSDFRLDVGIGIRALHGPGGRAARAIRAGL